MGRAAFGPSGRGGLVDAVLQEPEEAAGSAAPALARGRGDARALRLSSAHRVVAPQVHACGADQCWSADFVSDKLSDGRSIRILTVIDQFTRECIWLEADRSMNGPKVVVALTRAIAERGARQPDRR